jgi:hypothetical protein
MATNLPDGCTQADLDRYYYGGDEEAEHYGYYDEDPDEQVLAGEPPVWAKEILAEALDDDCPF